MNISRNVLAVVGGSAVALVAVAAVTLLVVRGDDGSAPTASLTSPYAGQEGRGIVALSQEDVEGLLEGAGTPFGGMAKPAELNGYPGPRHVLDAFEEGQFDLSDRQRDEIEGLYEQMRSEAIPLGEQIIETEQAIDDAFSSGTMTEVFLEESIETSASLYAQLRLVHLSYHLATVEILGPEQVAHYNQLRGYAADNPCATPPPEGHDPELWRQHNNCP